MASKWSGFHALSRARRMQLVRDHAGLTSDDVGLLHMPSGLPFSRADAFIENAAGTFPLPLGFAVGFVIDDEETVVPMAVEESSVVAAACHGAKLAGIAGGFTTQADDPITIGQVELRNVAHPKRAAATIDAAELELIADAAELMPSMAARGGGLRQVVCRVLDDRLVVHLLVDTRDAMGANVVNTLCEEMAPRLAGLAGGRIGLRILTNLATRRMAEARCVVPAEAVGGPAVVEAMVEAEAFAHIDPYRAATHNKGILNGIDPVCIATGNDWRAVEAGAHAYAAFNGPYQALTQYGTTAHGDLSAMVKLPISVGTVGGVTTLHPVAQVCWKILGSPNGRRLARILAAVGLAQNIAAVRALATDGIQAGHMALHDANRRLAP